MAISASRPPPTRRGRPRVINDRSDVRAAAVVLFAELGYRATGVRDIADALGIGPTSIYSHIKTKAELLHEIVIDFLDTLLTGQQDAIASTPYDPTDYAGYAAVRQGLDIIPTVSTVGGDDRDCELFHWCTGNLADHPCCTQVK